MNGTLSFYEYRFSGGDTQTLRYAKEFKVFALTGSRDAKTLGVSAHGIARAWDTRRNIHYFSR